MGNTKRSILLIVEDDIALMKAITGKFGKEGFDVLEAKNGVEGLEMALKHKPNLILLDIVMPKMDGITMLKKLRGEEQGKDIPVILLTNLADAEYNANIADKNVLGHLIKTDWSLDDIVKKVEETLK